MNILEINFSDLVGHIFNGYDLHLELLKRGFHAGQIVLDKRSLSESVKCLSQDPILHYQIREFEKQYSISNLLFPYGEEIINSFEFQSADIVHYHILHNGMVSLLDYPRLMNSKKSVWTIHDPWIISGNCVHPLSCSRWKTGCGNCRGLNEPYFEMQSDNTAFMWKQKRDIMSQINPHIIVASHFMEKYLKESPITEHFTNIHVIPFGIRTEKYDIINQHRKKLRKAGNDKISIGFRTDSSAIKGNKYIYDALLKLDMGSRIELLCVGAEQIPGNIKEKYHTKELGWIDSETEMTEFYRSCDIFLMPSLAESFGIMAIEAMGEGCTVISFQGTVLEEITNAPECGIAVEYASSDALAAAITRLLNLPGEIEYRGEKGHDFVKKEYSFDSYAEKHIKLYQEIMEN